MVTTHLQGGAMKLLRKNISISVLAIFFILLFGMTACVSTSSSYKIPSPVEPSGKHLFFLHGTITEEKGAYATTREYGTYDYHHMVKSFRDRGFTVISEIRPQGTNKVAYAKKVVHQINTLINSGVLSKNISVVGFSKGGDITLNVAAILKNPDVRFVVMAGCGKTGRYRQSFQNFVTGAATSMQGHFLSVYDANDAICGSCQAAFNAAGDNITSKEIELYVGRGHGTFYEPRREWLDPVVDWINSSRP